MKLLSCLLSGGGGGVQRLLRHLHHPQPDVQEGGGRAAQEQALQRAHDVPHEGEEPQDIPLHYGRLTKSVLNAACLHQLCYFCSTDIFVEQQAYSLLIERLREILSKCLVLLLVYLL